MLMRNGTGVINISVIITTESLGLRKRVVVFMLLWKRIWGGSVRTYWHLYVTFNRKKVRFKKYWAI